MLARSVRSIMFPSLYSIVNGGHAAQGKNTARDTKCVLQSKSKAASFILLLQLEKRLNSLARELFH